MAAAPADRLLLPLAPRPAPPGTPLVEAQLEEPPPEPPGLMDRPIGDTVAQVAAQLAQPAKAAMTWGKSMAEKAVRSYGGLAAAKSKPAMAAAMASLVAWFLFRALGSLVQLAAVALAGYVAFGALS